MMQQRTTLDEIRGRVILVAAVLILASCGGAGAEQTNEAAAETAAAEQESTTTTAPPTTTTTAAPTTSTSTEAENTLRTGGVVQGEVELNMLEPAVTLIAEDPWDVAVLADGAVILQDPERLSQWTRAIGIVESVPFGPTIDDWADTHDTVTIESRTETQVGGLDAVVYDISYTGDNELAILTAPIQGGSIIVRNTEYYRIWMIETGTEKPLALFAPVLTDDLDWLNKAERIVATIEFAA